jgi:hypothetical protein
MATLKPQTCGPLYKVGLEQFTGMDPALIPVFAAGFVSGEAEKIYLGACRAAMFRPSEEWFKVVFDICLKVGHRYGLQVRILPFNRGREIWVVRDTEVGDAILKMQTVEENSEEWHEIRGRLCGVPGHKIDYQFHEREGFGERCD